MSHSISFFVPGIPKAQPRVKFASRGKFGHAYTPDSADGWKQRIAIAAKPYIDKPLEGPIEVSVDFYFPRPLAHYTSKGELRPMSPLWHITKPDRDNLEKCLLDTLTRIGAWRDDCQVCDGPIRKRYAATHADAGASITISCLT